MKTHFRQTKTVMAKEQCALTKKGSTSLQSALSTNTVTVAKPKPASMGKEKALSIFANSPSMCRAIKKHISLAKQLPSELKRQTQKVLPCRPKFHFLWSTSLSLPFRVTQRKIQSSFSTTVSQ